MLLLRTYGEARVCYGAPSTGEGPRVMPSMWKNGSYAELEQQLIVMRESRKYRQLWWHVCHRYRFGTERNIVVNVKRTIKGAEFSLPRRTDLVAGGPAIGSSKAIARVYQWDFAVDDAKVAEAVKVLTALMFRGRYWNIRVPQTVMDRALGKPIEPVREMVA